MFEKEAERTAVEKYGGNIVMVGAYETGFIEGAEFGYNKANKWHYVKDELPPEDVPLLCVRGGRIYVAWYYNGVYHDSRCSQVQKPYAWKEIVLPNIKE